MEDVRWKMEDKYAGGNSSVRAPACRRQEMLVEKRSTKII